MIYLDTRHCGYDLDRIGFPSVQTCMAIVLETADWLVGWHSPSASHDTMRDTSVPFREYVRKMGQSAPVRLYAVTHLNRGGLQGARVTVPAELKTIAGVIGFAGEASLFFMPGSGSDYVECRRRGGGERCEVHYANDPGLGAYEQQHVDPAKTRHQQIKPGTDTAQKLYGGEAGEVQSAPIVQGFKAGQKPALVLIKNRQWLDIAVP